MTQQDVTDHGRQPTSGPRSAGHRGAVDVRVVGAGIAGRYALRRLRGAGLSVRVLDGSGPLSRTW